MGAQAGEYYFPSMSGVGRSLNYYPIGHEKPEDGVAEVAVGLGKYIVDGGMGLRFSPKHPESVLQTSELTLALRDTQTRMYVLDMKNTEKDFRVDDGFNILKKSVQDIAPTGALRYMTSVFDYRDNVLRDNDYGEGRRVVTFNNVLKHNVFPLADAVNFMLTTGQREMSRPVEIEFAGMIERKGTMKGHIYWLQIRPIVDRKELVDEHLLELPDESLIMRTDTALGHGTIDGVRRVVYVRPEGFSSSNNSLIAREIEKLNREMTAAGENYILVGPGRWGSSDTALGIPVKWPQISNARLIVESAVGNYRVEPSQGTHFFQNLTSFGVGYFTIDPKSGNGFFDVEYLNSRPAERETDFLRVVLFDAPLAIGINGRKGIGVVAKPEAATASAACAADDDSIQ